jgi:hypothetical protein
MPPKDNTMEMQTRNTRHSSPSTCPRSMTTTTTGPKLVLFLELEIEDLENVEHAVNQPTISSSKRLKHEDDSQNPITPPRHGEKKVVTFSDSITVYEVTHHNDMDQKAKDDVWYTDDYLRLMRCNMLSCDDDDDDDDDDGINSNDNKLQAYLSAKNIRRSRQLVLAEQARQRRHGSSTDTDDMTRSIQNEYCRVATPCQQQASKRGQAMANQVTKIWGKRYR